MKKLKVKSFISSVETRGYAIGEIRHFSRVFNFLSPKHLRGQTFLRDPRFSRFSVKSIAMKRVYAGKMPPLPYFLCILSISISMEAVMAYIESVEGQNTTGTAYQLPRVVVEEGDEVQDVLDAAQQGVSWIRTYSNRDLPALHAPEFLARRCNEALRYMAQPPRYNRMPYHTKLVRKGVRVWTSQTHSPRKKAVRLAELADEAELSVAAFRTEVEEAVRELQQSMQERGSVPIE